MSTVLCSNQIGISLCTTSRQLALSLSRGMLRLHPKRYPIPYVVHYFWPDPYGSLVCYFWPIYGIGYRLEHTLSLLLKHNCVWETVHSAVPLQLLVGSGYWYRIHFLWRRENCFLFLSWIILYLFVVVGLIVSGYWFESQCLNHTQSRVSHWSDLVQRGGDEGVERRERRDGEVEGEQSGCRGS
jgi:hypothetical protein